MDIEFPTGLSRKRNRVQYMFTQRLKSAAVFAHHSCRLSYTVTGTRCSVALEGLRNAIPLY